MDDGWPQGPRGRGSGAAPHAPGPWKAGLVALRRALPAGSWVERAQEMPFAAPRTALLLA